MGAGRIKMIAFQFQLCLAKSLNGWNTFTEGLACLNTDVVCDHVKQLSKPFIPSAGMVVPTCVPLTAGAQQSSM